MIFLMLLVRVEQKRHTEKSMRSADSKTRNVFLVPLKPKETEVVDSTSDLMNDDIAIVSPHLQVQNNNSIH